MSLIDNIIKNSSIKMTSLIEDSKIYNKTPQIPTSIPMVNVALSGKFDGGIQSGLVILAGPSKHFKSQFGLLMVATYLKADPEAVLLFYDSEFGTRLTNFEAYGIDLSRVIHTPVTNIEFLKFDIMKQINMIERKDKVFILVDSIGNLASKKEVDDALDGKSVADMTRAKQLKSLFRMVTPELAVKDIPMFAVNHTYKTMEMFSRDVVSGGTGLYYSADDIWIVGRRQEKDSKGVNGWNFIINIEKSRVVKEKSKIPIMVKYDGGIQKWSGLRELAVELGFLVANGKGKWSVVNQETGEVSDVIRTTKAIDKDGEFWKDMIANEAFSLATMKHYTLGDILIEDDDE